MSEKNELEEKLGETERGKRTLDKKTQQVGGGREGGGE